MTTTRLSEVVLTSTHPFEDALESYVVGKMPVTDQANLEEHLLICAACCEALEETFGYVEAIKSALRDRGSGTRITTGPRSPHDAAG
jgi:hypothetical protein